MKSQTERDLKKALTSFFKEQHSRRGNNRDMWGLRMGQTVYSYGSKPSVRPTRFVTQIDYETLTSSKVRIMGLLNQATSASESIQLNEQSQADVLFGIMATLIHEDDHVILDLTTATQYNGVVKFTFKFDSAHIAITVLNRVVENLVVTRFRGYCDTSVTSVMAVYGVYEKTHTIIEH